jgi:HK97 family phage major capsid protein
VVGMTPERCECQMAATKYLKYLQDGISIMERSQREGRDMSLDEYAETQEALDKAKSEAAQDGVNLDTKRMMQRLGGSEGITFVDGSGRSTGRLGDFVNSKAYQRIKDGSGRGQNWSSGPVEVGLQTKGTVTEGTVAGGLTPAEYQPGIVSKLFQPIGLSDYFGQATTGASHYRYVVEGTATNAAAGVAEGGAKPESTLVYSEVDEPVKKIATSLPVSDELLEDAESFQGYLNGRLTNFVQQEEERQLLRGAGTDELVGIVGRSGVNTLGTAAAGTIMAEHILKAATGSRGSAFVDPDTIVLHPTNWQTLRLSKDTTGQYLGGGPWTGSYGQPGQVSTGYFSSAPIWNMNVWVTTAIGSGTALLGSFKQAAQIVRRGGPSVEVSNAHSDFFVKNLNMVRAESRLALAVFRPASFVTLTF